MFWVCNSLDDFDFDLGNDSKLQNVLLNFEYLIGNILCSYNVIYSRQQLIFQ